MDTLPRIAVCQPHMHWTIAEHVQDILQSLKSAADRGAQMVLFPELTLTGLHAKVPELLDPPAIDAAIADVAEGCRAQQICAAIGTPIFAEDSRPLDACLIISETGDVVLASPKMRLMPPGEPLVFQPGTTRPTLELAGTTLAVVICREMLDHDDLTLELDGRARVILWPGVMARGPHDPLDPGDYATSAIRMAREQSAWILHSNWATNVQVPGLPNTGKSLVISPSGEMILEAPAQTSGFLLAWENSLDDAWVAA